jgi:pilus assembly protein Flp/PilA
MDLLRNERGQTLIEYALLLVLIALVVYIMVNQLGHTTNNVFCNIDSALGKAPVTP